ncbi:NAD-P-binding protein [Fomes fomentarius]|nr:NAD-P-binding protein [Fomes fomentarius]
MSNSEGYVWFITGANRGIGLGLTKQLLESSAAATVIATTRNHSTALTSLSEGHPKRLHVLHLDVIDPESIRTAAVEVEKIVGDKGVDYLVNNAGIVRYPLALATCDLIVDLVCICRLLVFLCSWIQAPGKDDTPYNATAANLLDTFETNVVGPALVSQAFLPLVQKSQKKTVLHVSSALGVITLDIGGPLFTSYSISKAALNMLVYKQAKEHPDITTVAVEPGWLKTDLGGPHAPLEVPVGVAGILKLIPTLTKESSGQFFNHKGERLQW